MALSVRSENGIEILTPKGMLLGGKETEELEAKIGELNQAGNVMLLLDMSKVTFMSSIAIATVIRAHISYSKRQATVKICALDKHIRQIFVIAKLTMVFGNNLHDTVEDGLQSFRTMAPATATAH
jgi:anti-anti-sigma factor